MLPKSIHLSTWHRTKKRDVLESTSGSDLEDDLARLENNLNESELNKVT